MKRLQKDNPNTVNYWNTKYKGEAEYDNQDEFKFKNIAHYIYNGSKVLDLGCGGGDLVREINTEQPQCWVTGLDYSNDVIEKLKKESTLNKWVCADATNTGLVYNSYDFVTCCETLEHVDDPELIVKEAYRLLKDDGRLIVTTPFRNHIPSPEHVWEFEYHDIEDMLENYFDEVWAFPWASGWTEVRDIHGQLVFGQGHWDTIMGVAIK